MNSKSAPFSISSLYDFKLGSLIWLKRGCAAGETTPHTSLGALFLLSTYFPGFISKSLFSTTRQTSSIITAIHLDRWNYRQHSSVSRQLITIIVVCLLANQIVIHTLHFNCAQSIPSVVLFLRVSSFANFFNVPLIT